MGERHSEWEPARVLQSREAVAQTPGEDAGSFLSVGSEFAHLVRRERPVHREIVPHRSSGVHFRERAARFLRRLYATASRGSESAGEREDALASCPLQVRPIRG